MSMCLRDFVGEKEVERRVVITGMGAAPPNDVINAGGVITTASNNRTLAAPTAQIIAAAFSPRCGGRPVKSSYNTAPVSDLD